MHQSSLGRVAGIQISPLSRDCGYRGIAAEIISASSLRRVDGVYYGINDSFARGAFCVPNESPICIRAEDGMAVDSMREGFVSLARALDRMARGILVSAGTERVLFDALLAPSDRCEVVLMRDLDPIAVAYMNAVILFLKLAESPDQFKELALIGRERISRSSKGLLDSSDSEEEREISACKNLYSQQKIKIGTLLERSSELPELKEYYLKHLPKILDAYYGACQDWRKAKQMCLRLTLGEGGSKIFTQFLNDSDVLAFDCVDYLSDLTMYQKLREFALEGRLIASQGDINDLKDVLGVFKRRGAQDLDVAVIDFSNIHEQKPVSLPPSVSPDCLLVFADLYTSVGYVNDSFSEHVVCFSSLKEKRGGFSRRSTTYFVDTVFQYAKRDRGNKAMVEGDITTEDFERLFRPGLVDGSLRITKSFSSFSYYDLLDLLKRYGTLFITV